MKTYNLKIQTYNLEPRTGWYICDGKDVLAALEDAFTHYEGLRQSYQNLVTWEVVR